MTPQQQKAIDIRARLRCPPNAVADTGINMKNGAPVLRVVRPYESSREPSRWQTPTLTLIWEVTPYYPPAPLFIPIPPVPSPDIPPGHRKPNATAILVLNETCLVWGIQQYMILSGRSFAALVRPRWAAMAIIRRLTPWSFPQIGKFFGGRDHATVWLAKKRMTDHIAALNQELDDWSTPAEWVRALKARIEA